MRPFAALLFSSLLLFTSLAPTPGAAEERAQEPGANQASAGSSEGAEGQEGGGFTIERLPASAYPQTKLRGIEGGSLNGTFHGLQFPYYPRSGIGISGSVWVDTGYEKIKRGNPAEQSIDYLLQQGRLVARFSPTYTRGSFFVQGQAELVANKDQSLRQPEIADTDDLWIKVGQWDKWDVQVGRFEGWEVYHFGMGLDLNTLERVGAADEVFTVPGIYGLTYAYYRPASIGQAAVHYYPRDFLRFELGTQIGNEFGQNAWAARPVGVFDLGYVKVKLGAEYKKANDQKENSKGWSHSRGIGGAVQGVLAGRLEAGLNGAYGLVDRVAQDGVVDEKGSVTTYSVGGFANVAVIEDLVAGAGLNYTFLEDLHYDPELDRVDKFSHTQTFVAVEYLIAKTLTVKLVAAYARGNFAPTFGEPIFKNEMLSARLRLAYGF